MSNTETQIYEQNQHDTEIYVAMATNMSNLANKSTQFYLIYSVYNAILFFSLHFDCQVLDVNLERKKLSVKKIALPWKRNGFLYGNNMWF